VCKEKTKVGVKARQRRPGALPNVWMPRSSWMNLAALAAHTRRQQRINACLNLGQGPNLSGIKSPAKLTS